MLNFSQSASEVLYYLLAIVCRPLACYIHLVLEELSRDFLCFIPAESQPTGPWIKETVGPRGESKGIGGYLTTSSEFTQQKRVSVKRQVRILVVYSLLIITLVMVTIVLGWSCIGVCASWNGESPRMRAT